MKLSDGNGEIEWVNDNNLTPISGLGNYIDKVAEGRNFAIYVSKRTNMKVGKLTMFSSLNLSLALSA